MDLSLHRWRSFCDHSGSGADDDKPIVGHRLLFLLRCDSTFSICTGSVLFTLEQAIARIYLLSIYFLFTFYLTPNGDINNYFWPFG